MCFVAPILIRGITTKPAHHLADAAENLACIRKVCVIRAGIIGDIKNVSVTMRVFIDGFPQFARL